MFIARRVAGPLLGAVFVRGGLDVLKSGAARQGRRSGRRAGRNGRPQRTQFLKNAAILGGLLLMAFD